MTVIFFTVDFSDISFAILLVSANTPLDGSKKVWTIKTEMTFLLLQSVWCTDKKINKIKATGTEF